MRAAARGGGMPMPRPWYEVDADEDAIWPQQAARTAAANARGGARCGGAARPRASAAERGAAIARTALTAAPDVVARAVEAATTSERTRRRARRRRICARLRRSGCAIGVGGDDDARRAATATWAPAARATTPLGRALAHAAWVDAQLRTVAAPIETAARGGSGYVFVAPRRWRAQRRRGCAKRRSRRRRVRHRGDDAGERDVDDGGAVDRERAGERPCRGRFGGDAGRRQLVAGAPGSALPAMMPTAIAQRMADFVARLVGVQSARDVAPRRGDNHVAPAGGGRATRRWRTLVRPRSGPSWSWRRPRDPASWRPGAAAARVEQLGARIDARVSAAWGEPATTAAATARERRERESASRGGAFAAADDDERERQPAHGARRAAQPRRERIYVAPAT